MNTTYILQMVGIEGEDNTFLGATATAFKSKEKAIDHMNYLIECDKEAGHTMNVEEFCDTEKAVYFKGDEDYPISCMFYTVYDLPVIE